MSTDLLALKVSVDAEGLIWYSIADQPPIFTRKSLVSFLLNPLSKEISKFRVMGTQGNVELILALFLRILEQETGSVEVCSPLACKTQKEREDPIRLFLAARSINQVSSLGGWHNFNKNDYPTYALSQHLTRTKGQVDDHARRLLKTHPNWAALTFIPHINMDACCKLLALILDPRWYLTPTNPNRGSKLRSFLGLDIKTLLGVIGKGPIQRYHERCKLVFDAIQGNTSRSSINNPAFFLHRIMAVNPDKRVIGLLRAMQTFVEYLRLTWLAALGSGKHQNEALFVPEYFFKSKEETDAFLQHMRRTYEV
jgi:hypothetical protein